MVIICIYDHNGTEVAALEHQACDGFKCIEWNLTVTRTYMKHSYQRQQNYNCQQW
jgi:hypothetical protein